MQTGNRGVMGQGARRNVGIKEIARTTEHAAAGLAPASCARRKAAICQTLRHASIRAAIDHVVSVATRHSIVARAAIDGILPRAAIDQIATTVADKAVIACAAVNSVVARAAGDRISPVIRADKHAACRCGCVDVVTIDRRVDGFDFAKAAGCADAIGIGARLIGRIGNVDAGSIAKVAKGNQVVVAAACRRGFAAENRVAVVVVRDVELVSIRAAIQRVIVHAARKRVTPGVTIKDVVACAADDSVVAIGAKDRVIARAIGPKRAKAVVAGAQFGPVVARAAKDGVVTRACIDDVIAKVGHNAVIARACHDRVIV